MSSKLTRKLLKASEDDFRQLVEPTTARTSKEATPENNRKRKKTNSGGKCSFVEMSEDDILRWYVGGMVQADKFLSSPEVDTDKKQSKSVVAESLRRLERDNNLQTKQRKTQAILNKTKGSSRTAPVQQCPESLANRYVPTFNKVRYERQKRQELHEKIAKKLKAIEKSKVLKLKKNKAEEEVK